MTTPTDKELEEKMLIILEKCPASMPYGLPWPPPTLVNVLLTLTKEYAKGELEEVKKLIPYMVMQEGRYIEEIIDTQLTKLEGKK